MSAFRKFAQEYWDRGLSPLPLEPGTKHPARGLTNWTAYGENLPKSEKRLEWLRTYGDAHLGVCLNSEIAAGWRMAAVDVDNEAYVRVVATLLGSSISSKRGKKGITHFVRVPSKEKLKSRSLNTPDGKGAIDFLASGRMTVLPPSVHPETGNEYRWIGKSLLEIELLQLPIFDQKRFSLLERIVKSKEAQQLVTGETTHSAGLSLTAQLVAYGCTDDEIQSVVAALLPDGYDGNSLDELPEWIHSARAKGFDTERTTSKKQQSASSRLNDLVDQEQAILFHDDSKVAFITVSASEGFRHFAIRSSEARLWLTKLWFDNEKKALNPRIYDETVALLEARARFNGSHCQTYLRVGSDEKHSFVDLGLESGTIVEIGRSGWALTNNPTVKLIRSPGFGKLPPPSSSGGLSKLRDLVGLPESSWTLVLAFMLLSLRAKGPYMLLLIEGEQGSGKSFLSMTIKSIIDPNKVAKGRLPESERDLMIHAQDFFLLCFDNVSGMKGDLSDTLCLLSTGGGFATRKLYTDGELFVLNYCRPIIINGIADFASRADLLERSILLKLPAMNQSKRRTESQMQDVLQALLPSILSDLYQIVGLALANPVDSSAATTLRMADCEHWLAACEPFTGLKKGAFVKEIQAAQEDVFVDRVENDLVVGELRNLLERGEFNGTISDLFELVTVGDRRPSERYFPPTPAHLSRHLARLKPSMTKLGIHIEFGIRTNSGRKVRIWSIHPPDPDKRRF